MARRTTQTPVSPDEKLTRIARRCVWELEYSMPDVLQEALLRSTKSAVENLILLRGINLSPCDGGSCEVATAADDRLQAGLGRLESDILAAWPDALLQ